MEYLMGLASHGGDIASVAQVAFRPNHLIMSPAVSQAYRVTGCSVGTLGPLGPAEGGQGEAHSIEGQAIVRVGERVTLSVVPRKGATLVRFAAGLLGPVV